MSVKNIPRFLSKLESGPIPLNIALLRVYLILAQITVYYTLYIYAATEQLYILAIFPTDNHRFQNSNDENYLLVFDRENYGTEARNLWKNGFSPKTYFFSLFKTRSCANGRGATTRRSV